MNCRYCHAPLPEDSPTTKQFCSASHKVMFSRNGARPLQLTEGEVFTKKTFISKSLHIIPPHKPMPTIPKKVLKKPVISVEEDGSPEWPDVIGAGMGLGPEVTPKVLKKVAIGKTISKPSFTGPRQWPTDITLGEVKDRLKRIRVYRDWAVEKDLRGQIPTRAYVEGLLAQAGQPASLADLVFGPKQKEEEEDNIPG